MSPFQIQGIQDNYVTYKILLLFFPYKVSNDKYSDELTAFLVQVFCGSPTCQIILLLFPIKSLMTNLMINLLLSDNRCFVGYQYVR